MDKKEACRRFSAGEFIRHKSFEKFSDHVSKELHHGRYHESNSWFMNYFIDKKFEDGWSIYSDKGLKETMNPNIFQTNKGVLVKEKDEFIFYRILGETKASELADIKKKSVSTFRWREDSINEFFTSEIVKVIFYE